MMHRCFLSFAIIILLCVPGSFSTVAAQDKDDDLKPDQTQHIEKVEQIASSAEIEKQNPEAAAQIREFLRQHIEHANSGDVEIYMGDFLIARIKQVEELREYTKRAMQLKNLKIEQLAVEFAQIQPKAATVHTRQRSSYINEHGDVIVDDVILSYRLQKNDDDQWKILMTERQRLSAGNNK